jgi:hypothetical protein
MRHVDDDALARLSSCLVRSAHYWSRKLCEHPLSRSVDRTPTTSPPTIRTRMRWSERTRRPLEQCGESVRDRRRIVIARACELQQRQFAQRSSSCKLAPSTYSITVAASRVGDDIADLAYVLAPCTTNGLFNVRDQALEVALVMTSERLLKCMTSGTGAGEADGSPGLALGSAMHRRRR